MTARGKLVRRPSHIPIDLTLQRGEMVFVVGDAPRAGSRSEAAKAYLERPKIAHKVSIRNGAFSTIDLSTGQRKRLALVHCRAA